MQNMLSMMEGKIKVACTCINIKTSRKRREMQCFKKINLF